MRYSFFSCGLILLILAGPLRAQSFVTAKPDPLSFTVVLGNSPDENSWNECSTSGNTCSQNLVANQSISSISVQQVSTAKFQGNPVQWINNNSVVATSSTTLRVTVNATNLATGDYLATIKITVSGARNSPLTVPVEFHVFPVNGYSVNPGAITTTGAKTFTINSAAVNNFKGTLSIVPVNPAGGNLVTFSDAPGSTAKNISATGKSFNQSINVDASGLDASMLPNGASAYVYFSDTNDTGSTQEAILLPTLVTDTNPIAFTYSSGGFTTPQTVTITTNYVNAITFTPAISSGASAFAVSIASSASSSCTTPCELNVSAKSGLSGVFSGTLSLSPSNQSALPLNIPLTLSAAGSLSTNVFLLDFALPIGSTTPPAAQQVTVSSTGGAAQFSVQSDAWIVPDHTSGTTGTPSATINVTLNPAAFPSGSPVPGGPPLVGYLTFSSPLAGNSPAVTVAVSLTNFFTAPASLSFSQSGPASQSFTLGSGGPSLPFNIQSNSPWLSVSPQTGTTPKQITVTANSSAVTPATNPGSLTVSDPTGNAQTVGIPVTFTLAPSGPTTSTLTHVADGNAFKTAVILTNSDTTSAAAYTLRFYGNDGNPPASRFELETGSLAGNIPAGQSVTIRTAGLGSQTVQGWGEVTAPATVGGTVIYSQPGEGAIQEGTATIVAAGTQHFFLPFDNTNGAVSGAAITNPGTAAANNVTVTLRYDDGSSETVSWGSPIAPRSHQGFAVPQQFSHAAGKSGVAEFVCDQPLDAVVFRFNATGAYTALNTVAAGAASGTVTRTITHTADGNSFKTAFLLTNSDTAAASYTLRFYGNDGNPPASRFELEAGTLTGSILPGKSVTIRTAGLGSQTVGGWAELTSPGTVGGSVIYSQPGQGAIQEGTVNVVATASQHFFLTFDNTNGAVTGAAITNPGTVAANNVMVTFRYGDGTSETLPWGSPVAGRSHQSFAVFQQFPHATGKSGVAEFVSDQPLTAVVFRFNSTGAFTALGVVPR